MLYDGNYTKARGKNWTHMQEYLGYRRTERPHHKMTQPAGNING
jgi:hypothetical protein